MVDKSDDGSDQNEQQSLFGSETPETSHRYHMERRIVAYVFAGTQIEDRELVSTGVKEVL